MSYKFNPITGTLDYFEVSDASSSDKVLTTKICDETISALKLVVAVNSSNVLLGDSTAYTSSKCLGLALTSGNIGEVIDVLLFGKHEDVSFTFTLNEPLFLSSNGSVTQTPPTVNFTTTIGHSLGNGAIFIDIREPIQL